MTFFLKTFLTDGAASFFADFSSALIRCPQA